MKWPWHKPDPNKWSMEITNIIMNNETGELKSRRYSIPIWTNVCSFHNNFIKTQVPEGWVYIGHIFHRFESDQKDVNDFNHVGNINNPITNLYEM